jgi:hypothetical protein
LSAPRRQLRCDPTPEFRARFHGLFNGIRQFFRVFLQGFAGSAYVRVHLLKLYREDGYRLVELHLFVAGAQQPRDELLTESAVSPTGNGLSEQCSAIRETLDSQAHQRLHERLVRAMPDRPQ